MIIILMPKYLFTQYFTVTVTGVATIALIGSQRPFISKNRNRAEILQEIVIICIMYHVLCFTDFVPDPALRNLVGYSLISCTLLHLFVYFGLELYFFVKRMVRRCKISRALSKARR